MGRHRCSAPIPGVIDEVNRRLMGWGNYVRRGHPGRVFASMNWYVQNRLRHHLKRRNQHHLRIPEGESFYALLQRLGVRGLRATRGRLTVHAIRPMESGEAGCGESASLV
jgi:hypothetical protein